MAKGEVKLYARHDAHYRILEGMLKPVNPNGIHTQSEVTRLGLASRLLIDDAQVHRVGERYLGAQLLAHFKRYMPALDVHCPTALTFPLLAEFFGTAEAGVVEAAEYLAGKGANVLEKDRGRVIGVRVPAVGQVYATIGTQEQEIPEVSELMRSVRRIVRRKTAGRSSRVQIDDLEGFCMFAIMEAARTYREDTGGEFSQWLSYLVEHRLQDALRHQDPLTRRLREFWRAYQGACAKLRTADCPYPETAEIAEQMGLNPEALQGKLRSIDQMLLSAIDEETGSVAYGESSARDQPTGTKVAHPASPKPSPLDLLLDQESQIPVRIAIGQLSDVRRSVLTLYYLGDIPLHRIGILLGVTESRISQHKAAAEEELREMLRSDDVEEA